MRPGVVLGASILVVAHVFVQLQFWHIPLTVRDAEGYIIASEGLGFEGRLLSICHHAFAKSKKVRAFRRKDATESGSP